MNITRCIPIAAFLLAVAGSALAAEANLPPPGPAQPPVAKGEGKKPQAQALQNEHRNKRRDAQQRLRKALEEKEARRMSPPGDLPAATPVKGGAK